MFQSPVDDLGVADLQVAARVLSDQYYKMYIPLLLRAPEANAAVLQQTVHYGGLCKQNRDSAGVSLLGKNP